MVVSLSSERRMRTRYPVRLNVRYRSLNPRGHCAGEGGTIDMSSASISIRCRHDLVVGDHAEILVDWPSLLDSRIPLQLVVVGDVVRTEPQTFVVRISQHQFRTARSKPLLRPTVFQAIA